MIEKTFDVVIVGSGAGGGAAAQELSELCGQGLRVAVLERGPRFRDDEFTGQEIEMAQKLYADGGGFLTRDRSMTLAFAHAYGGSTVVYTGTSLIIRREVINRWGVPDLEHRDLVRRAEKYQGQNNVHLLPDEEINDNNRLFREGCQALGYRVEQFPVNLRNCRGSGLCNLGCPNQAKQGTNRAQLPMAEKNGVEIVTRCHVDRIEERVLYATVHPQGEYGEPPEWEPGRYKISAHAIVLAAGAVNSPALLLRSNFGSRLPQLGRYFTTQPALILVGEHSREITNYHGHPKSFFCDEFEESGRFLLETCMYFPFTTAKNLAGFGAEPAQMLQAYRRLQMILVLALDPALRSNRVTVDGDGKPVVDYRISEPVIQSLLGAMRASARIFFAAGATRVHAPASQRFYIEAPEQDRIDELIARRHFQLGRVSISAAHLMGGCRMGTGPGDSVTDSWGQVHGLPWLFVADASLFPQAADINPYLTIMAFSDRVAQRVRERIGELSARAGV